MLSPPDTIWNHLHVVHSHFFSVLCGLGEQFSSDLHHSICTQLCQTSRTDEHLIHPAAHLVCTRLWSSSALIESKGLTWNIFTRDSSGVLFTFFRQRSTQFSKVQSAKAESVGSVKQNIQDNLSEWVDPSGKHFILKGWWESQSSKKQTEVMMYRNRKSTKSNFTELNLNVHHLPVQSVISVSVGNLFSPLCLSCHPLFFGHGFPSSHHHSDFLMWASTENEASNWIKDSQHVSSWRSSLWNTKYNICVS